MERAPRPSANRIALAIVGALIVASIGAVMAIGPTLHLGFPGFTSAGTAQPTATSPDAAQDQPTETSAPPDATATRTPRPTATDRPCVVGTGDLHGTITSVNTAQNSFALRVCGATKTIRVDANTK